MKSWQKVLLGLIVVPTLLLTIMVGLVISQQDTLVDGAIDQLNKGYQGEVKFGDSHISLLANFPYISIDLEQLQVYEGKSEESDLIIKINDAYVGFDLLNIIQGNFQIKKIKLEDGFLNIVQHTDGSLNLTNAFASYETITETAEEESINLDLNAVELINIDLIKLNESNNILAEAFIEEAKSSFATNDESISAMLDAKLIFNLVLDGDTSFLHHKHVEIHTAFSLVDQFLKLEPSELVIEKASFSTEGTIDIEDNMNLNLDFSGRKPNFDLFLAFVPPEISPILARYDNGGDIYFEASVIGPSVNGLMPKIDLDFGCAEAFIENTDVGKGVEELFFKGHFTNGEARDLSTSSLIIEDFSAVPESGDFNANIKIQNFESPDIEMQINSNLSVDFITGFLNIDNIENAHGDISLQLNFHDIIDLDDPQKSIERLNESYFTKFKVEDLSFSSPDLTYPVQDVNVDITMDGHEAKVDQFDLKLGKSDISIKASISDLPAILHHTSIPVEAVLDVKSEMIDIYELTRTDSDSSGFNEQIKDLDLSFKFNSSARAITESPNLPIGEFFINRLNFEMTNYPHKLKDFRADVLIDSVDFRVIDFSGLIDESDFHFNGKLANYDLWFEESPIGDTQIDFDLDADLLRLEDLFSYGGENYVPEDYRHEEFRKLHLHGMAFLEFDKKLKSARLNIDEWEANMNVHDIRFEDFQGKFLMDSTRIVIQDLGGKLGNSSFNMNMTYFRNPEATDQPHSLSLNSDRLDFDQLFAYNPPPESEDSVTIDHDAGFNIFELPFSNMNFDFQIDQLNYHRYLLDDFVLTGRMQKDHYIYVDTMAFGAAGGNMGLNGYFNGSDPSLIYFSPEVKVKNIDLDKLLFKFENFGQDYLVSENLHGQLSGTMEGKIHMHADLVPSIDDSELNMDINVLNGSLNNFDVFEALSDYFTDKNLSQVRFDTLTNEFLVDNGVLTIPNMKMNTTLGYFEISGKQSITQEMEYYVRIPIKVIAKAGMQKLFGKKDTDTSDQVDEIQYRDETKRTRFLNLRITGTTDDYEISLGKDKSQ